ncbi:HNH endonuclease [Streptomyces sp. NPDC058629]|uniref:HNH endonuclease n=1 Tax=Streptomyces sp. NPDC058629 TaxID=3346565 RepID=UPI003647525F
MPDVKPFTCIDCGLTGVQEVRGRNRLRCEACKVVHTAVVDAQRPWAERKAARAVAQCEACGRGYPKYRKQQRWCSLECGNRHKAKAGPRLAPEVARERRRLSWQQKCRRRRAAKRGGASETYTLVQIAERDRARCGLCGGRVAMKQRVPHPKAPTIDHVIPVSEGGDDTRANVQLAHFQCNSAKGARGSQQLALIG